MLEENQGFDLILIDWNMPNMKGLEFIQKVKAGPFKDIPIIMVTTEAEKNSIALAIRAGAKDYITKPIKREVLKEKIRTDTPH